MTESEIGKIVQSICKELGPGLLETVYEVILFHLLRARGLRAIGILEYLFSSVLLIRQPLCPCTNCVQINCCFMDTIDTD